MKRSILTAAVLAGLSVQAFASAPGAPSLTNQYANYNGKGFVTVTGESGAYNTLVSRVDVVDLPITWSPAWSGDAATSWEVLVNGVVAAQGTGVGGSTTVPITTGGLKEIVVRVCNDDGCAESGKDTTVISDTDGSHLMPLGENIDPANTNYEQNPDQIVGTYFVEWGIYGRKYFVENVPANNLTHIIYGFIPMCGQNQSLKDGNEGGWSVLQADCAASQDYELVIHDMGAAFWRQNGTVKAMKLDGTAVAYGEVGAGNFGHLMALKQGNPHLKIVPSIGGWTLSDPFYGFTDKANRDTFVASSKEFLKTWKFFDGIDIDWEFPGGGGANTSLGDPVNDGPAYVALMQELRAMLDELEAEHLAKTGEARKYELTSAIGVGWDKLQDVDYAAAAQYMDNIFMMSYDFYGAWGPETGHQTGLYCGAHVSADKCAGTGAFAPTAVTDKTAASNLGRSSYAPAGMPEYNVSNATRLLLQQGVPAKKLVVGAAMYGRGWTGVEMVDGSPIGAVGTHVDDASNNPLVAEGEEGTAVDQAAWAWEAGIMDYRGALLYLAANPNADYVWDSLAEASFIWDPVKSTLITLDTPQSIAAKGVFLQAQGLGGIFSWEIDGDGGTESENLLNAMNKAVGNQPGITTWDKDTVVTTPCCTSTTNWVATAVYSKGDSIDHNGVTYVALYNVPAGKEPGKTNYWQAPVVNTGSWSATATYSKGDQVTLNGVSYTAVYNVPAGKEPGKTNYWKAATTAATAWSASATYSKTTTVTHNGVTYTAVYNVPAGKEPGKTNYWKAATTATTAWSATATYSKTTTVTHNGVTYTAVYNVPAGKEPGKTNYWKAATTATTAWSASATYSKTTTVTHNGVTYAAVYNVPAGKEPGVTAYWSAVTAATAWSSTATYSKTTTVTHNGITYTAVYNVPAGKEPGKTNYWTVK